MCVNYKLCVKLHKGPFAFNMEKFPSLEIFYTHAVTGVTDNYHVCHHMINGNQVTRATEDNSCSAYNSLNKQTIVPDFFGKGDNI